MKERNTHSSVIKLLQHLSSFSSINDLWTEASKSLIAFFDADFNCFAGIDQKGNLKIKYCHYTTKNVEQDYQYLFQDKNTASKNNNAECLKIYKLIEETFHTGELNSVQLSLKKEVNIQFYPISSKNKTIIVLVSGRIANSSISNEELNDNLAIAGFIGNIYTRLQIEHELKEHDLNLGETVNKQTQKLFKSNQELKALNQQFEATDQQLRAANQQLNASNKQLISKESALKESEEKFRTLVNSMNDIVFMFDTEKRFKFYHAKDEADLYIDPEKFINKSVSEVMPENICKQFDEAFENVLKNNTTSIYTYSLPMDGAEKWYSMSLSPLEEDGAFSGVLGIGRDISDLKEKEKKLTLSEERFKLAMQATTDGVFDWNIKTNEIYFSPGYFAMLGYSPKELPHTFETYINLVHPEDKVKTEEKMSQYAAGEIDDNSIEMRFKTKSGEWNWILSRGEIVERDADGNPLRFVGTNVNIHKRKLAEQALKKSEEQLRSYITNAPDGIFIANEKGQYLEVNPAATNITGFSEKELLNMSVGDVIQNEYLDEAVEHFEKVANLGYAKGELGFKTKKGENRMWSVEAVKLDDNRFMAFAKDITKAKEAEAALKESEERYRKAEGIGKVANWEYNIQTGMFWGSEGARKIYGFEPDSTEFTAEHVESCIPERKRVHQALVDLIEKEKPYDLEFDIITRDKGIRKTIHSIAALEKDQNSNPLKVTGVIQDITEQKRAEEENKKLLFSINTGVYVYNFESKLNDYINPSYSKITGWTIDEINNLGEDFISLFHPEDRHRVMDHMSLVVNSQEDKTYEITYRFKTKNGNWIWCSSYDIPFERDKKGNVKRYLGSFIDITEKKEVEEEMRKSEELFRTLASSSPAGVYLTDKGGKCTYANPYWLEMAGMKMEEALGSGWEKAIHPDDKDWVLEQWYKSVNSNGKWKYEYRFVNKQGRIFWVDGTANAILDNTKSVVGYVGINRDITSKKKAEEQIKLNEMHLTSLVEHPAGYIVYRTRLNRDTGQIEVIKVSPNFTKALGIPETAKENFQHWFANVHPDDLPSVMKASEEGMKPPFKLHIEIRNNHPEKGLQWFDIRATGIPYADNPNLIEYANGMILDITEKKNAEIELYTAKQIAEENEYKVRSMFENTQIGILYCDAKGNILELNPVILEILGSPSVEATKNINTLTFKPLVDNGFAQNMAKCINEKQVVSDDTVYTSKWGKTIFMKYYLVPVIINTKVIGVWANLNNLTDLFEIQKQLEIAKQKAEESDKLKSAFLANMSHEIRTPMNGIIGFSERLKKKSLNEEQRDRYIEIIQNSSHSLLTLINDIIDISKIEAGQLTIVKEPFMPGKILHELNETFSLIKKQKNKNNVEFVVAIPSNQEYIEISSDPNRIKQVLINLLGNALKFTENGTVEYGYKVFEDRIQFFVKDEGIGIAKKDLGSIFNRFEQASTNNKTIYEGTGLGLSITKGILDLMGGEITVDSTLGKGTIFEFSIPYEKTANEHAPTNELGEVDFNTFKGKIIIIAEDDLINLDLYKESFKGIPVTVLYAQNGKEAVDLVVKNPNVDLVLMDIRMPLMDGMEAAKLILKQNPRIKIIAQTAHAMINDKKKFLQLGFVDYIPKPIDIDELFKRIAKWISQ